MGEAETVEVYFGRSPARLGHWLVKGKALACKVFERADPVSPTGDKDRVVVASGAVGQAEVRRGDKLHMSVEARAVGKAAGLGEQKIG